MHLVTEVWVWRHLVTEVWVWRHLVTEVWVWRHLVTEVWVWRRWWVFLFDGPSMEVMRLLFHLSVTYRFKEEWRAQKEHIFSW